MKFKLYMLLPFSIIGILIFNYNKSIFFILIISMLLSLVFIKHKFFIIIGCLVFLLSGFWLNISKNIINDKYNSISKSEIFSGKVVDVKEKSITIKNNRERYKICFSSYRKIEEKIALGDTVYLNGSVDSKKSYRENNMASRSLTSYGKIKKILDVNTDLNLGNISLKIKDKINKGLSSIDKDAGAFVSGLITGYRSDINEEDLNMFMELDILHIIAVSGFNVAIIYASIMLITKRLDFKTSNIIGFLFCLLYIFITGFDPSITRAFIMITVVILGKIISKKYSTINSLSLAAFIMISINPFCIYNLGFIFSYLATLSISIFNCDILNKIENYTKLFKDEVAATISSTILTLPVILYTRGYISLISILVNVVLSPIISFITILGFITCFIYTLFSFDLLLYPVVFLGDITLYLIRGFSNINKLIYIGQVDALFIACYYILVFVAFNIIKFKKDFYKYSIITVIISIVLLKSVIGYVDFKIHFINVGQGDSIFLELPGKKTMLIDTGDSKDEYIAAKSKVVPYIKRLGYNKIDYMVITHFHSDHSGGLEYIESTLKVLNKISYEGCSDKSFIGVASGDEIKISGVEFNVLSPSKISYDDENKNSLIISANYKDFNCLLTGDATKEEMDKIKGNYNVLKVPHHGSKYSVSKSMFENTNFENAVIPVGKNGFGHPSNEFLDILNENKVNVYRTDINGDIVFTVKKNKYKIKTN